MAKSHRVIHLLQQAHSALFRAVDGQLKVQEGIVSAHQVLLLILRQDNGLTAARLAALAGMQPSRLTALLDTLESKGLIRREASPDDRRVSRVVLTDAGLAMADRTAGLPGQLNRELLAPFDPDQQETIVQFLRHVIDTAGTIAGPEPRRDR